MQEVDQAERIVGRWFQQDRTCAVAKDDTGRTIGIVDDRRHNVHADDEDSLVITGDYKSRPYL